MNDIKIYTYIALFTIYNNKLMIALDDNNLINKKMNSLQLIDEYSYNSLKEFVNIKENILKQVHTYNKIINNTNNINVLYIGILDYDSLIQKNSIRWVDVKDTNDFLINEAITYFKEEITKIEVLKRLYKEFTLPQLQKVFEDILSLKLDRRNFRKKLLKLNIIEQKNDGFLVKKGRPANIYKFKDINNVKKIFNE